MKLKNSRVWMLAAMVGATISLNSCGEDDTPSTPEPKADFSAEVDGKTVTFTDNSTDAESYSWDFNDGSTSTEASPSHTFNGNGSYIVKLTVTNSAGEDDKSEVLEIINISIDGSFAEWDDVEAISSTPSGTVTALKIENLGNTKLFVYVEGTDDLTELTQISLDLDNDATTGAMITWRYPTSGDDVLIEGSIPTGDAQYAAIYECAPCDGSMPGEWNWGATPINEDITSFIASSAMTDVAGGKAYEFSIDLTALGSTVNSTGIGIGFMDMSTVTWDVAGATPALFEENDNPEAALYPYTFK